MKIFKLQLIPLFLLFAGVTFGQSTCPNDPMISDAQVLQGNGNSGPLISGENGTLTFTYSDNLADFALDPQNGPVKIVISLLSLGPVGGTGAISGTLAGNFDWVYNAALNSFQGTQNSTLLAAGGTIVVAYEQLVEDACGTGSDTMGFGVNIQPPGCMNGVGGNATGDDGSGITTCVSLALPVELIDFEAKLVDGKDGSLTWRTATELNNDRFEIERSFDGFNFEYIAELPGAGTTQTPKNYLYIDSDLPIFNAREIYYRLRQVDYDGTESISNIELITLTGEPSLQVISVEFGKIYRLQKSSGSGIERVDIYNTAGQLESSDIFGSADVVDIDIRALAPGVYVMVINEQYKRKLVVVK